MAPDPERFLAQYGWLVGKTIASLGLSGDPEVEDLEQEARLALFKAAQEFDPRLGHKASSFAIPRVRGAILEFRRSKASWVRRAGQKAKASVDAAVVALELRGEDPTPETIRALLEDPRDYDRAAALPVLVPLLSEFDEPLYEEIPGDGPPVLETVWEREGEALIERAIRRLCALDRACFRGCIERGMGVREVADRLIAGEVEARARRLARLGYPLSEAREQTILPRPDPQAVAREVTRRRNKSLSLVRSFLNHVSVRFTQRDGGINQCRVMKPRGRPPGRRMTVKVNYLADAETRERALRLAARLDVSEAEVHRRAIRALWEKEQGSGGAPAPGQK